jgi:glycosyltransferase involved in cell wall biosynthesis
VIVGPVDTRYFSPGATAVPRRGPVTVLCVGRVMPHKGVDRIIQALPAGMRLRVVGKVYHEGYQAALRVMAIGKAVEFIDDAGDDELREYYRSADVLVQASTHLDHFGHYHHKPELMGLTTLEALACGLPVIVSDAGSLPELAADADFSLVFKDVADLRTKLTAVRDRAWPAARAPERLNRHVSERHGIISCGNAFLDLYSQAIARSAA